MLIFFASAIRFNYSPFFSGMRIYSLVWREMAARLDYLCTLQYSVPDSIRRAHAHKLFVFPHRLLHTPNEICASHLTGTWRMKDKMENSMQCELRFLSRGTAPHISHNVRTKRRNYFQSHCLYTMRRLPLPNVNINLGVDVS